MIKATPPPPWATLRELEAASLNLEKGVLEDKEIIKWINLLLAPGASLGGARPKAGIMDEAGNLWIAKFPSIGDSTNIGGWELVAYQLAADCGILMSEARAQKFNNTNHTFLTKRFDRQGTSRLHFASAMTLLGYQDGQPGASYLNIVEFITKNGANVAADLEQLFRRIVFSIAIKNTDDHLRNHGFILTPKGWVLSPAYDINPVYNGNGLSLNIDETDNALHFELARAVALYFRLTDKAATAIITQITEARKSWRNYATALKIPRAGQELMEAAFTEGE